MNLMEVYNRTKNPLNKELIEDIIKKYSSIGNITSPMSNIYTIVTNTNRGNQSKINEEDKEKFYNDMFNSWKDMILKVDKQSSYDLYSKGCIDDDFVFLRRTLANNEFKDYKEFEKYCEENSIDYKIHAWNSKALDGPWTYVHSDKFYSSKHSPFKIEHRLYINTNAEDLYKMVSLFREKCDSKNIPYVYKYNESSVRDDGIVIYSSTELLETYLKVLNEIKKENPDLVSRINEPPILSGKMGYVGYGSEPDYDDRGMTQSFNRIRSDIIEESINEASRNWFKNHLNLKLGETSIEDAIVKDCAQNEIKNLINYYNYTLESRKKDNKDFDESVLKSTLGYDLDYLETDEFKELLNTSIRSNVRKLLEDENLFNNPYLVACKIPFDNGNSIDMTYGQFSNIIMSSTAGIMKFDNNFSSMVYGLVCDKAKERGIDPNNFAFDVNRVNAFKLHDEKVEQAKKEIKVEPVKEEIKFPSFDELKDLATKYRVEYDTNDKLLKVYDISTNNEEKNAIKAQDALFANIWLSSAGVNPVEGEVRRGITEAFNDDNKEVYDYLIKGSMHSISKTGDLNSLFLFKNSSGLNNKDAERLICSLFNNDYQTLFLDNYIQNRCESSLPKNKKADTLGSIENANNMLAELNNDKKVR